MTQEVKNIAIQDLVLWTENPRDRIDEHASDQDIVDMAFNDKLSKWELVKLSREMGEYYDFSELPTVVYHGEEPVVYDGNRRVALGKIKLGFVTAPNISTLQLPTFPEKIPCNVCDQVTALKNVYRKHSDSGSWQPLERDIFLHRFFNEPKSTFLVLEEETGIISYYPHLNKRFVKEEIFNEDNLKALGFTIDQDGLKSIHRDDEASFILDDIAQKIKSGEISTRKKRGKVIEVISPSSQQIIDKNRANKLHPYKKTATQTDTKPKQQRQAPRTPKKEGELFGGKLYLHSGDVSDLYRDIVDMYEFYINNKSKLSQSFTGLIRMALRLLCETAAKDQNKLLDRYLKEHFDQAKQTLSQDIKTTLSAQNVHEGSIVQLLHTGAHNYKSSTNMDQTIALSLIIGAILTITHG